MASPSSSSWLWLSLAFSFLFVLALLPSSHAQNASVSPSSDYSSSSPSSGPSESFYQAHGWLLWIAFGVLFPFGILFSKYGQESLAAWFHFHWIAQILATFCATAGIAIGLKEFAALADSTHAKLGLALGLMIWLQFLLAFVRPRKGGCGRQIWYFSHWLLGTGSVILGWFNIFKGLDLYVIDWPDAGSLQALYIAFSVQVAVLAFAYLFLDRWAHLLNQSKTAELRDVAGTELQSGKMSKVDDDDKP